MDQNPEIVVAIGRQMRIERIWFERAAEMVGCLIRGEATFADGERALCEHVFGEFEAR